MDDFSWGQTRKIIGDDGKVHGDKDGVFDSSHIVMKRWADFERERRYKSGNVSRDSTYDLIRRESPRRAGSTRYSVVSVCSGVVREHKEPKLIDVLYSLPIHTLRSLQVDLV